MPQSFDIEAAAEVGELVVHLSGELDLSVRAHVFEGVSSAMDQASEVERLVIDLGGVTFCDSSGLGALLDIKRAAGGAGIAMVLRSVPPPVERLLDLTDVDGWLTRE